MTTTTTPLTTTPTPTPSLESTRMRRLGALLASPRVWMASATAYAVSAAVFFRSSAPFSIREVEAACGQPPLDVRFTSSAEQVSTFLSACGPVGRELYRNLQVVDLVYPLIFGLFLASSLALVISLLLPRRPELVVWAGLALVGSGFDYLENAFAWAALRAYPDPAATDSLLGVASAAKTTTFWLVGTLLMVSAAALAIVEARRWLRRRRLGRAASAAGKAS